MGLWYEAVRESRVEFTIQPTESCSWIRFVSSDCALEGVSFLETGWDKLEVNIFLAEGILESRGYVIFYPVCYGLNSKISHMGDDFLKQRICSADFLECIVFMCI